MFRTLVAHAVLRLQYEGLQGFCSTESSTCRATGHMQALADQTVESPPLSLSAPQAAAVAAATQQAYG